MLEEWLRWTREARRRPASFVLHKLWDRGRSQVRSTWAALGGNPYAPRFDGKRKGLQGLIFKSGDLEEALGRVREKNPRELECLQERALSLAKGEVCLLSRSVRVEPPVDWQLDSVSGRRWPVRFHSRYRYRDLLDLEHSSDIKMPWELSRLQFLPVLALAARISGDASLAERGARLFEDWQRQNPVGYGVGWAIGMEASLRAISLIWTMEILADTGWEDLFLDLDLPGSLGEHGRYVFRNLEYSDVSGNHYTSCLLGLLYLGLCLPSEKESREWRRLAVAELEREILNQVYPDGVCHEGSIPYHRLVLELFLHAAILCRRNEINLSPGYWSRLEKMFEFVAAYTKPNGEAPVWGDADDGRVVALGSQTTNDHRYLLGIGESLYGRDDLGGQSAPLSLDTALLLEPPPSGCARPGRRSEKGPGQRSIGFLHAGFFLLRQEKNYCLIDCGDVGLRGRGGHGHNDALSVEICITGHDFLVDSGCSSYTRSLEARIMSIAARAHNVARIGEREPAPIDHRRFPHASACPVEVAKWEPEKNLFIGRHFGFSSSGLDYYQRRVELHPVNPQFVLEDLLNGSGFVPVSWFFHLAPGWEAELCASEVRCRKRGVPEVRLRGSGLGLEWRMERARHYPQYGLRREHLCLCASMSRVRLPVTVRFEISVA